MSREDLFSSLESILAENRVDIPWLLKILDQEHAKVSLPQDIYDAVKMKVMEGTDNEVKLSNPSQSQGENLDDEDLSRTQIATSMFLAEDDESVTTDSNASSRTNNGAEISLPDVPIKGVGDVLNDRFVLEERVGSGGMSTVYKALDRRKLEADDRDPYIAVKILNLEFRAHPDSLIALQREAKKCHKLAHPNIVRAYDFDRDGATVFMTMEYLTGHSLAKILRDPGFKGMPFEKALPIISGMSQALAYAHKNGIVHADFKPANVILTDECEVKVIDFGIARAFQKQGESETEATRFDPGSLGALTPTYASPEMLEHKEPDPRDDVYALACIVYEMLTGRHPFGRRQANEARDGGLALQRKTLSRRQWRALRSALQFDRDKRTPSVSKFFTDINPEYARTPILAVIAASVFLTALLIGMGAFLYDNGGFNGLMSQDDEPQVSIDQNMDPPVDVADAGREQPVEPVEGSDKSVVEAKADSAGQEVANAPVVVQVSDEHITQSVNAIISKHDCAAMISTVNNGDVVIEGYLLNSKESTGLKKSLAEVPGVKQVTINAESLTENMCRVVDVYRDYWLSNRQNNHGTSIVPGNANGEFVGGEPLVVTLKTPSYDSYVNVDYFSKDGHVVHMLPSVRVKQNQAPANYTATLGDLGQWVVSEPYGRELVVILTSPSVLFEDLRGEYEKTEDYLKALMNKFKAVKNEKERSLIAADFVFINTRAN
ncbi:MAG: protein kinase [Candidatus Thiodiazotropha sp.]